MSPSPPTPHCSWLAAAQSWDDSRHPIPRLSPTLGIRSRHHSTRDDHQVAPTPSSLSPGCCFADLHGFPYFFFWFTVVYFGLYKKGHQSCVRIQSSG